MGKSSKQTTTSVNQRLPAGMEPANTAAYQAGLDAAQNFTPQVYDGQRVADLDPLQLAQRDLLGGLTDIPDYITGAQGAISGLLGPNSPVTSTLTGLAQEQTNPLLQTMLDSAIGDARNAATSQYAGSGRLGSAAFGDALGEGITQAAAPILQSNLQADRDRQLKAALGLGNVQLEATAQADDMLGLTSGIAGLLGEAGGINRSYEQSLLDAQQQAIAEGNAAELNKLNALLQAAGMASGNFTTTGTDTETFKPGLLDYIKAGGSYASAFQGGGAGN